MILVVNPNPAVDRVAVVDYREKQTLRPERFSLWAGGSGVHAGYVAHLLGGDVLVLALAGGHGGARFRELLRRQGLSAELVDIRGETRGTYSLLDVAGGEMCNVVEPSPTITRVEEERFAALALRRLREADVVIVSGSVPDGCSVDLPARLVAAAHDAGVPCIADLAGAVLRAALPYRPWLVKPSRVELGEYLGRESVDAGDVLPVAMDWRRQGVGNVCVSLDAEGIMWVSPDGEWRITSPAVPPYNTIGCGDTLVGAVAATYAASNDLAHALRVGVAAAAANVAYDAPGFCTREDVGRLLPRTSIQSVRSTWGL